MNNRNRPPQRMQQAQPQRLSPGVYRMPNGSLGNGQVPQQRPQGPQAIARPGPGNMPQGAFPQNQQFNPNQINQMYSQGNYGGSGNEMQSQFPEPWAQPGQMGNWGGPQGQGGGYGIGNFMQQQMPQQMAQGQLDEVWKRKMGGRTQAPPQPLGILGAPPPNSDPSKGAY